MRVFAQSFFSLGHFGPDRSQIFLLPEAIDDYVVADNPVRSSMPSPKATGRPANHGLILHRTYGAGDGRQRVQEVAGGSRQPVEARHGQHVVARYLRQGSARRTK
jgi:hypothetical protein